MAMSKTSKVLLLIVGIVSVVVIVGVIAVALLAESFSRPSVPDNSVLVLSVSGDLPDYVPEDQFAKAIGMNQQKSFNGLLTQLRKEKIDNRVQAVVHDI